MVEIIKENDLDGIEVDLDYPDKNDKFYFKNIVKGEYLIIQCSLAKILLK